MKSLIPASLVVIGHSIVDWWDGWIIMILMTILWLLCQITVILGPPATFGLYYAVHEMLGGGSLILGLSLLLILPIFLGFPAVIPILGLRALANRIEAFGLRKAEPPQTEIDIEHNPQSTGQKSNFDQLTSQKDKDK